MPKRKKTKQEEAKERQDIYNKLSIKEKIAKLNKKLGKGVGAVKQRKKLGSK